MNFSLFFTFFALLKSLLFHPKPWFPKTHHIYRHFLSKCQFVHSFWFEKWRGSQPKFVIYYKQIACRHDRNLDDAGDHLLFDRDDAILLITTRLPDRLGSQIAYRRNRLLSVCPSLKCDTLLFLKSHRIQGITIWSVF